MSTTTTLTASGRTFGKVRRFAPLAVIAAAIAAAFALGVGDNLSFEALRDNRDVLMALVKEHALLAVIGFITLYAVSTALSLPGGAVLSIAGGFLFGSIAGTAWVVIGATIGAVAIFLAARTALGDALKTKAGPWLKKMEAGFQDNAFNYLLVLRLVPLFPFFVVNLVPAFLGVGLRTFAIATLLGIIPGAFVFASVGAGLGSVFEQGETFSPSAPLTPEVIMALIGLAILALVPVGYEKLRARREDRR
ncbi:MAG: TVP38/TMEM64 family protein [Geminicoccaceae bacterium]